MEKYVINENFLQNVETLGLILKNNVAGLFGGNHTSKTLGSSCEFTDYRDYMPGDDISKIDWNAYQRFDKMYLKLFLDERQTVTKIYIDASKSMVYGKGEKATKSLELAATLAYLSICEMDKVSIYCIKDNKVEEVISNMHGKESFYNSINKLNEIEFSGDCKISESILPTSVGYGDGMSIIISDFLSDNDFFRAIDYLADKKRDILCVQVLSQEELKPTIRGKVQFLDYENTSDIYKKNINKDVANAYNEALNYVIDRIRTYALSHNGHYMLINDHESINDIFLRFLPEMGVLK